jgi:hypothetical protein
MLNEQSITQSSAVKCICCGSPLTTFHQPSVTGRGAGYTDARCINPACVPLDFSFDLTHYTGEDVAELARRQSSVTSR